MVNRGFTQTSPRYEITDNEERFQVAIDVPGVQAEDINISVEEDGQQVLSISGKREPTSPAAENDYRFTSRFAQRFYLDPTVDIDRFTAKLNNGVLVVTAPKNIMKIEENIRRIPVMDESSTNEPGKASEDTEYTTVDAIAEAPPSADEDDKPQGGSDNE